MALCVTRHARFIPKPAELGRFRWSSNSIVEWVGEIQETYYVQANIDGLCWRFGLHAKPHAQDCSSRWTSRGQEGVYSSSLRGSQVISIRQCVGVEMRDLSFVAVNPFRSMTASIWALWVCRGLSFKSSNFLRDELMTWRTIFSWSKAGVLFLYLVETLMLNIGDIFVMLVCPQRLCCLSRLPRSNGTQSVSYSGLGKPSYDCY